MMTDERENWAIAVMLERQQGSGAAAFIAERIAALAHDAAGQEKWRAIRRCYDQLQGGGAAKQ